MRADARALTRRRALHWSGRELAAFLAGLSALALAVSSPLEPFAGLLLSAHMVQHALLMFVAPPLLLLAKPQLPLMHGLPREVLALWVLPALRGERATILANVDESRDRVADGDGHAARVASAGDVRTGAQQRSLALCRALLLFRKRPDVLVAGRAALAQSSGLAGAAMLPYLLLAMLPGTVLCAFLAFSDRVIYPRYTLVPRVAGISALTDQSVAGALMWVLGIAVNLIPLTYIAARLLYPHRKFPYAGAARERPNFELRPLEVGNHWPKLAVATPGITDWLPATTFAPLPIVERPMTRPSASQHSPATLRQVNHPLPPTSLAKQSVVTTRTVPARTVPRTIDLLHVPVLGPFLPGLTRVARCKLCCWDLLP